MATFEERLLAEGGGVGTLAALDGHGLAELAYSWTAVGAGSPAFWGAVEARASALGSLRRSEYLTVWRALKDHGRGMPIGVQQVADEV